MSACGQKTPNPRCFLKRRLTNTPRCHCLAVPSSHYFTYSRRVSARLAPPDVLFPSCLVERSNTLTAVYYGTPIVSVCRKYNVHEKKKHCMTLIWMDPKYSTILTSLWSLQKDEHLSLDTSPRRAPMFTDTRSNPTANCWHICVPTRTRSRLQIAGPPCFLLSLSHRFVRRPMLQFPPEVNSSRFLYYCTVWPFVLSTIYSSSII